MQLCHQSTTVWGCRPSPRLTTTSGPVSWPSTEYHRPGPVGKGLGGCAQLTRVPEAHRHDRLRIGSTAPQDTSKGHGPKSSWGGRSEGKTTWE